METKRIVNQGAESFLDEEIKVLDKGHIILRDYLGSDESIVAAARVSYNKDIRLDDHEGNARLIDYLLRHWHTSPFEQAVLTFDIKAPIFVFRELVRHRTARLNEISGRYAQLPEEWYEPQPERIQKQSKTNKQGSGDLIPLEEAERFIRKQRNRNACTFADYNEWVEDGLAREIARIDLPLSTYSRLRWQIDLHNLLHFLRLRSNIDAQWEIREFADALATVVKASFPKTWVSYEEHRLNAVTFSATEKQKLASLLQDAILPADMNAILRKLGINPQ